MAAPGPAALVCEINRGEAVLRDPAATPERITDAGSRVQAAYRTLGEHPEWDAVVLTGVEPGLRAHTEHAALASRELASMHGAPRSTLPAWRIVEPLPAERLRAHYDEAQRRFGVPWQVLAAVNLVETRMGRIVGLSSAGAQGPMQFMPRTWAAYGLGGDVWKIRDAVLGAANYLAANGASVAGLGGDVAASEKLDRALFRYNNDVRYVRAIRHYAAMMTAEPQAFVGLHAWPVDYRTTEGVIPLPPGYASQRPIPVAEYLATRPR